MGWPRPLVSSSGLTPLASTISPLTWVCMYYAYNIRTYNSQAIKVTGVALWHTNQQFRPRRKVKQFRWLLHRRQPLQRYFSVWTSELMVLFHVSAGTEQLKSGRFSVLLQQWYTLQIKVEVSISVTSFTAWTLN